MPEALAPDAAVFNAHVANVVDVFPLAAEAVRVVDILVVGRIHTVFY